MSDHEAIIRWLIEELGYCIDNNEWGGQGWIAFDIMAQEKLTGEQYRILNGIKEFSH